MAPEVRMRCPTCDERDTRVIDSRDLDEAATIRRRRECVACGARFTTYERIEAARLVVVKRDGQRQEFDRDKLAAGIRKALTRRPVPDGAAERAADEIEAALRSAGTTEVDSSRIGELAMEAPPGARPDRLHPASPESSNRYVTWRRSAGGRTLLAEREPPARPSASERPRRSRTSGRSSRPGVHDRALRTGRPPAVVCRPTPYRSFLYRNNRYAFIDPREAHPDYRALEIATRSRSSFIPAFSPGPDVDGGGDATDLVAG